MGISWASNIQTWEKLAWSQRVRFSVMDRRSKLLEVVAALPEELVDQALSYVQMLQNPIQTTSGICGGQARIRNTRIPVWTLVVYRQQGSSDEELLANYPGLTAEDLKAAWHYYEQNCEQTDREIAQEYGKVG